MGLREWIGKKAKEKQAKNVAEAAGQCASVLQSIFSAMRDPVEHLKRPEINQTINQKVDEYAARIASFSGGPMDAEELWREVYEPVIAANEAMVDPPLVHLLNRMLEEAFQTAVRQGVVRSSGLPPN